MFSLFQFYNAVRIALGYCLVKSYLLKALSTVLIGMTENILDNKSRLTLSTKWRADLASGIIITRGFDKCLFIFPQEQFQKIALEVSTHNVGLSVVRAYARHLAALAEYAEPDNQGRINIPRSLCQFAELNSDVTIVGVINYLEVWNPKIFSELNSQSEGNANSIAENYGNKMHAV